MYSHTFWLKSCKNANARSLQIRFTELIPDKSGYSSSYSTVAGVAIRFSEEECRTIINVLPLKKKSVIVIIVQRCLPLLLRHNI